MSATVNLRRSDLIVLAAIRSAGERGRARSGSERKLREAGFGRGAPVGHLYAFARDALAREGYVIEMRGFSPRHSWGRDVLIAEPWQ